MSVSVYGCGLSANSFRIIMAACRLVWLAIDRPVSAQRRGRGRNVGKRLESTVLIAFAWLLQSSIVYRQFFSKPIFQKLPEP